MHKSLLGASILLALTMLPALAGGEEEYKKGLAAYKARSYRTAAKNFEDSLANGNGAAEVYIYMAHSYAASGDIKKAVQIYRDTAKIFAGLPAEALAKKCIARLDPNGTVAPAGTPRNPSFIHRINVIAPTISGHPPVNPTTVGLVKSIVSRLPAWVYAVADELNATINIGPNFTDSWPDSESARTPGMDYLRLSETESRIYNNDVYIFERKTIRGSKELGPPISPGRLRSELFYQIGHIIDAGLGPIMSDKEFRAEYDKDRAAIPSGMEDDLEYYLQPDYVGSGEVIAAAISNILGGPKYGKVEKYFPKSCLWIKKRLEIEENSRTGLGRKKSASP
ncbi:MAG: tol-pal system YbgF family protein [Candidatus Obscuribacterales bacterium]